VSIRALALSVGFALIAAATLAGDHAAYVDFLARNLSNSSKLSVGMSKADVASAMGDAQTSTRDGPIYNPWSAEAFTKGTDTYEVLYFLVRKHPPFTPILRSQAIAVVFKNGLLIAWGREADAAYR
jgi:hypothetical protein